jgi:hypothetical protein
MRDSSTIVTRWLFDGASSPTASIAETRSSTAYNDGGADKQGDSLTTPSGSAAYLPVQFGWRHFDNHGGEAGWRADATERSVDIEVNLFGMDSGLKKRSEATARAHQAVAGHPPPTPALISAFIDTNSSTHRPFLPNSVTSPPVSTLSATRPQQAIELSRETATAALSKYTASNFNTAVSGDSFPSSAFANWRRRQARDWESTPLSPGATEFRSSPISSLSTSNEKPRTIGSENLWRLYHEERQANDEDNDWRSQRPVERAPDGIGTVDTAEAEGAGVRTLKSSAEAMIAPREQDQGDSQYHLSQTADTFVLVSETVQPGGRKSDGAAPREFVPRQNIYAPAFPHRK